MSINMLTRVSSNLTQEELLRLPYKMEQGENFRIKLFFNSDKETLLYWNKVLPTLKEIAHQYVDLTTRMVSFIDYQFKFDSKYSLA